MREAKVVRQIEAMDARERERLRQFVSSPYFNRHKATVLLLDYLLRELGKRRPKIEEARAREAVQKGGTEQAMADLQSGLMKLVNRFLAVEQLQAETFREEILTLKRTQELQRTALLENRGKRLDTKVARRKIRDADLHLAAYEWKAINGYNQSATNRADTREMQAMLNHLDGFYLVEKLRHACELTANMMMMGTHYDLLFLEPILAYLAGDAGSQLMADGREPSIEAYYHVLMSMREPANEHHYTRLMYYLGEGLDRLPPRHQTDVYSFAGNYCIRQIMTGQAAYRRELFDLYRRGIATGLMYENGEISEFVYKNVVTIGAGLGEHAWTEAFLEDNRERLPARSRENAYALNKARYLYTTGRLEEAAALLITVTDSDLVYHLARVRLEVQVAYDQNNQEFAINTLETFRLYVLRNKKMSAADKKGYNNYVRYAKQLINLKPLREYLGAKEYTKKMTALREAVENTDRVVERNWLMAELGARS